MARGGAAGEAHLRHRPGGGHGGRRTTARARGRPGVSHMTALAARTLHSVTAHELMLATSRVAGITMPDHAGLLTGKRACNTFMHRVVVTTQ